MAIKPVDLSGGQGIYLTRTVPSPAMIRDTGACVAQRYVEDPLLLDGRKFHLRLYLLVTAASPLRVFVYREGIVRIAPEPYGTSDESLARPAAHITNTALHLGHPNLTIGTNPDEEGVGNVWSLTALFARLEADGLDRGTCWHRLTELARLFVAVVADAGVFSGRAADHTRYCFPPDLFALDIVLDRSGRPWLLECQRNPSMTGSPMVNRINGVMFQTIFRMTVHPLLDDPGDPTEGLDDVSRREALEDAKEMVLAARFERLSI